MRDLGEIRRLQSELRRRDRLVALGNMAAGIAHEVRNPLSAIKGLARFFMEASPEGSDESRMADIMTREVLRLDKVVGDLLDFARPDVLNLTDVGLNELVERARDMVRSDMDARKIRFEAELPEPPLSVRLDRDRMTQVLLNLFLNAVQAMPDGGRLMVRARMEGTELALNVADTGAASPPNVWRIFSARISPPRPAARGWGFPLCTRSWKRTTARSKSPARRRGHGVQASFPVCGVGGGPGKGRETFLRTPNPSFPKTFDFIESLIPVFPDLL